MAVVNLDPANDVLPFKPAIDVGELVSLEQVQEEQKLGPNGGLVYCMDVLFKNLDWLEERLKPLARGERPRLRLRRVLCQRDTISCLIVRVKWSFSLCMTA